MFLIYLKSFILAVVQAVTEFVPVSSSGHLFLLHKVLGLQLADNLSFDIALHFGTVLALLIFFRKKIIFILKDRKLVIKFGIALVPAVLIGFFLGDYFEKLISIKLIAVSLFLGGVLFLLMEQLFKSKKSEMKEISYFDSLWIGLWQVLAFIPGVSRSGITIIAGLSRGLKKSLAAEFSFLLAIPLILGISFKKGIDFFSDSSIGLNKDDIMILLFGILSSAIIGYVVIKYFLSFLKKHSFKVFAWYRIILALLIFIIIYLQNYL
jgi:undecaprenyl-diphosphatase